MSTIYAIIPAAGRSSRMGQPKQLMAVAGRPMLVCVIEPIVQCDRVVQTIVVTNSLVASKVDLASTGATVVLNDEPDAEMVDSLRLGIDELQKACELQVDDGIMICPGDQPGMASAEIGECCRTFLKQPSKIIIAAHDGQRGHPIIFPASRIPYLMSPACDNGLRELVIAHKEHVIDVGITNSAVLRNINTPEDYQRVRED